jgi:hypothetical protein
MPRDASGRPQQDWRPYVSDDARDFVLDLNEQAPYQVGGTGKIPYNVPVSFDGLRGFQYNVLISGYGGAFSPAPIAQPLALNPYGNPTD